MKAIFLRHFLAISLACFVVGCASTETDFINDGLVAYYPFEGNAIDESGNGLHAGVSGAQLALDRFENPQSAYKFSASTDQIITGKLQKASSDFSYSLWINVNGQDEGESLRLIIEHRPFYKFEAHGSSHKYRGLFYHQRNEYVRLHYGDKWVDTGSFLEKNKWFHCVATWDGKHAKIYIDGELKADFKHSGPEIALDGYDAKIDIGAFNRPTYSNNVIGSLDDIRLYDRSLTSEEVKAIFDIEKPKAK